MRTDFRRVGACIYLAVTYTNGAQTAVSYDPSRAVRLSWESLIPHLTGVFVVDSASVHYGLFQDAFDHVKSTFSTSTHKCAPLDNGRVWPSSVGILVNLLADMKNPRAPTPSGDIPDTFHSTLDYLLYGVKHIAEINISQSPMKGDKNRAHCCLTCAALMHPSGRVPEMSVLQLAEFLGVLVYAWEQEHRMRKKSKWSPMPWSESSLRASHIQPDPSIGEHIIVSKHTRLFANYTSLPGVKSLDLNPHWESIVSDFDHPTMRKTRFHYGYPLDIPWLSPCHDGYPFCPNLATYVRIRRAAGDSPGFRDDALLWVAALTFGLMEAVMETKIPESHFVTTGSDGQPVLSGAKLSSFMSRWHARQMLSEPSALSDAHLQRGRAVMELLESGLQAVKEENEAVFSLFIRGEFPALTWLHTTSAVYFLVRTLAEYACPFWRPTEQIRGWLKVQDSSRPATQRFIISCQTRMKEAGWCLNVVSSQFLPRIHEPILSNFIRMEPFIRQTIGEHTGCSQIACTFYTIDSSLYRPHHTQSCTGCSFMKPPAGDVEAVLAAGDIPILLFDFENHNLMVASTSTGIPYVAISHVWADGLGSTTEVGLPTCQVLRILGRTFPLLPESGGAFWVDSLCVPSVKDLRKRAIKLMAQTYKDAEKVVVFDASIRVMCTSSKPAQENILRIATSGWVRRVWTLQEGILARKIYFEFADALVGEGELDFEGLLTPGLEQEFLPLLSYRMRRRRAPSYQFTYDDIMTLLQSRTTTKEEDELISVAGLLPIDIDQLLNVPGETSAEIAAQRMRSFCLQAKQLPGLLPFLPIPRLGLPNFRWAPLRLANATNATAMIRENPTCTPEGLRGRYAVGRLSKAFSAPIPGSSDSISSGASRRLVLVHRPTETLWKGHFHLKASEYVAPGGPLSFDCLLFRDEAISAGAERVLCAAVLQRPDQELQGENTERTSQPFCCDYVAPFYLENTVWHMGGFETVVARLTSGADRDWVGMEGPHITDVLLK